MADLRCFEALGWEAALDAFLDLDLDWLEPMVVIWLSEELQNRSGAFFVLLGWGFMYCW
jgi:uncharacterized protein YciU (UPF0263 family)